MQYKVLDFMSASICERRGFPNKILGSQNSWAKT